MSEIRLSQGPSSGPDLLTDILLFEQKWDHTIDIQHCTKLVADIVQQVKDAIDQGPADYTAQSSYMMAQAQQTDVMLRLNHLLDCFYLDLAFSSTPQNIDESLLNSLSYLIKFHTGESLSMAILLNHILMAAQFDSSLVVAHQQIMIRVTLSEHEFVLIDAICGDLESFGTGTAKLVLPGNEGAQYRTLNRVNLLQIFLTQQKLAFTDEKNFENALYCIELLIQTTPDDPYQRRDRGFLLHQLDCFKLARDDFEFFIEQCPQDPAAQLLKVQLEEFEGAEQAVVH